MQRWSWGRWFNRRNGQPHFVAYLKNPACPEIFPNSICCLFCTCLSKGSLVGSNFEGQGPASCRSKHVRSSSFLSPQNFSLKDESQKRSTPSGPLGVQHGHKAGRRVGVGRSLQPGDGAGAWGEPLGLEFGVLLHNSVNLRRSRKLPELLFPDLKNEAETHFRELAGGIKWDVASRSSW